MFGVPIKEMRTPAATGPTMRVKFIPPICRAMAFPRPCLPTTFAMIAWRAGIMKGKRAPRMPVSTRRSGNVQLVGNEEEVDEALIDDHGDLHEEDELAAVDAVRDRAAQGRDDQHGDGDDEVDDAEGEGVVVGEVVGKDGAHQELRHHGEHEGDVADVEPAELLVAER